MTDPGSDSHWVITEVGAQVQEIWWVQFVVVEAVWDSHCEWQEQTDNMYLPETLWLVVVKGLSRTSCFVYQWMFTLLLRKR